MIDARELRIGNIVGVKDNRNDYFREKYEVIDIFGTSGLFTLKELGSEYVKHRYPGVHLRPISLSSEILEKMGFTQTYHDTVINKFTHVKVLKYGVYIENNKYYIYKYNNFGIDTLREVRYVHILQNLIFSLTGEDLNVDGLI